MHRRRGEEREDITTLPGYQPFVYELLPRINLFIMHTYEASTKRTAAQRGSHISDLVADPEPQTLYALWARPLDLTHE